jgi:hypothetical protein
MRPELLRVRPRASYADVGPGSIEGRYGAAASGVSLGSSSGKVRTYDESPRAARSEISEEPCNAGARRMDYTEIFAETMMSSLRRWCNSFGENGAPLYFKTLAHLTPVC